MTDWVPSKDEFWKADGVCADPKISRQVADDFFSYDPARASAAKKLCFSCPVRKDCIKWALENNQIWGIWGGKDEQEIRRTLSVNADGAEIRRDRYPQCLYCGARTSRLNPIIAENPDGGRWTTVRLVECLDCGFVWRSRTSANAVNAYKAMIEEKKLKKEEKKKLENLSDS
jgi:WhiB family redox-sensing transcriptional regulator